MILEEHMTVQYPNTSKMYSIPSSSSNGYKPYRKAVGGGGYIFSTRRI